MTSRKILEKDVQKAILEYLHYHHSYLKVWRNNTGAMVRPAKGGSKRGFVRFSAPGVSDIIGFISDPPGDKFHGCFVAIEVKVPGKKDTLTENQAAFLDDVRAAGGIAIVADCIEDVVQEMKAKGVFPDLAINEGI